ncbi:MAG TPA: fasciclin domain-containing protein, partial [Geminicoccaceae bacterium]|nr:fasciclin domain-containing protein [Geminicoccaceae bacterium]
PAAGAEAAASPHQQQVLAGGAAGGGAGGSPGDAAGAAASDAGAPLATVTRTDIIADNGVIHIIDRVITFEATDEEQRSEVQEPAATAQ